MTSVRNNAVSAALLLGWVIFGCLNSSVLADVAQKSSEKSQNSDNAEDYYDESSPENMKAPVNPMPTLIPYFDEVQKTVYAKEDTKVILDCPAKNYNESHHVKIWLRSNDNAINNGREILVDAALGYHLDKDMSLVIDKVSEKTKGVYYCSILPQEVRMKIVLEIGEEPTADSKQAMLSASVLSLVLTLLSFGIVSLDKIF